MSVSTATLTCAGGARAVCQVLDQADVVFAAFFAFEMCAKLVAWGAWFCGER